MLLWMEPEERTIRTRTITSTTTITTTTISTTITTNNSSTIKIKTRTTINTAVTTSNPIHTSNLSQKSVKMLAGIVINLPLNSAERRVWSRTAAVVTKAKMSV